jgi:hypothetical protein
MRYGTISRLSIFTLVVSGLFLVLSAACEPGIVVKVVGGNPPTFSISGRSNLVDFFVCCEGEQSAIGREAALWEIEPYSGQGKPGEDLRTITYGIVPQGYYQTRPQGGQPAPPLVAGRRYTYHAAGHPTSAGAAFEIRYGKAVEIR